MSLHGTKRSVNVAMQEAAPETNPSFAYRQCLPTENPKAAIAHDAEVIFIQLTGARRLPRSRESLFA
jgi:hypothetical protein